MTRRTLRISLTICLLASAAFAAWSWFRPYAWNPDPAARCKIEETLVTRDQEYFWVNVHLKLNPGMSHDLQKPVYLENPAGKKFEPADSTFASINGQPPTEIWFKFWLEASDLTGPLELQLNDGKLRVKSGKEAPRLEKSAHRNFTTTRW